MSEESPELPRGWAWSCLGDLAEVIRGVTYEKADAQSSPGNALLPILRATNIAEGLNFTELIYVPDRYVKEQQYIRAGDIIIAASSGSRQVVGKAAQITFSWRGSFGAFCFALRPRPGVNSRYLALFMKTSLYRSRISALSAGININNLRSDHLKTMPIPLAPFDEQARIVAAGEQQLSRLVAADNFLKKVKINIFRYRATVLKAACEGRLAPAGIELPRAENEIPKLRDDGWRDSTKLGSFKLPSGWVFRTLTDLGEVTGGLTQNSRRDQLPLRLPFLRVANVYAGELRLEEVRTIGVEENEVERALLKQGDLLIVEGNGSKDQIGRVAIWNGSISPCLHQNHLIKVRFHTPEIAKYALLWLLSWHGRDQIRKVASSTSGLYTLSLSKVASIPIALPPLAEQTRIIWEVERHISFADEILSAVSAALHRSRSLRQAILSEAFAGCLASQDLSSEPASALLERIRQAKTSQSPEPRPKKERTTIAPAPFVAASSPAPEKLPPPAEPEPEPPELDFLALPRDEQVEIAWGSLFGQGAVEKDAAIRSAAEEMRNQGLAAFKRLRQDGPLYGAIAVAIERGVRDGSFDRPRRGFVRAVLGDPKSYETEDWRRCLLEAVGAEPIDVDAALRAAAEKAREAMGLEYQRLREDGIILTSLHEALEQEVRSGGLVRKSGRVRRG